MRCPIRLEGAAGGWWGVHSQKSILGPASIFLDTFTEKAEKLSRDTKVQLQRDKESRMPLEGGWGPPSGRVVVIRFEIFQNFLFLTVITVILVENCLQPLSVS